MVREMEVFDRDDDFSSNSEEKERCKTIKKRYGEYAICNLITDDEHWICCCGMENILQHDNCTRCGRIKKEKISENGID